MTALAAGGAAGAAAGPGALAEPGRDCPRCPRLVEFRGANRADHPDWHNAPVPSFGGLDARILVVGLAPGLKGANRTGRPFTGDYAGDLLYSTLSKFGLARGHYGARPDDGFTLAGARVTNAVRCVPPGNKPLPAEFAACRPFLAAEIAAMPNLRGLLAIGRDAHEAVVTLAGLRKSAYPFAHGRIHPLPPGSLAAKPTSGSLAAKPTSGSLAAKPTSGSLAAKGELVLCDSYHCSRYNTNTGRLTEAMFHQAVAALLEAVG